jgi:hypothetical protein
MLNQPIMDKVAALKLGGMQEALWEQMESQQYRKLSFEERGGSGKIRIPHKTHCEIRSDHHR